MDIDYSKCNGIRDERFNAVRPKDYAEQLQKTYSKDISLWYKRILPASKAKELYVSTNGDYSKIWHDHCECCFKPINKNTDEMCYLSEDQFTWLCGQCYEAIFGNYK